MGLKRVLLWLKRQQIARQASEWNYRVVGGLTSTSCEKTGPPRHSIKVIFGSIIRNVILLNVITDVTERNTNMSYTKITTCFKAVEHKPSAEFLAERHILKLCQCVIDHIHKQLDSSSHLNHNPRNI